MLYAFKNVIDNRLKREFLVLRISDENRLEVLTESNIIKTDTKLFSLGLTKLIEVDTVCTGASVFGTINLFGPLNFHSLNFHPVNFHPLNFHPLTFYPLNFYRLKFHRLNFHPLNFHLSASTKPTFTFPASILLIPSSQPPPNQLLHSQLPLPQLPTSQLPPLDFQIPPF